MAEIIPFPEAESVLWDRWRAARRAHEACPCPAHLEDCVRTMGDFYKRFLSTEDASIAERRERLILVHHYEGDHVA
jgi:hypothetical protein